LPRPLRGQARARRPPRSHGPRAQRRVRERRRHQGCLAIMRLSLRWLRYAWPPAVALIASCTTDDAADGPHRGSPATSTTTQGGDGGTPGPTGTITPGPTGGDGGTPPKADGGTPPASSPSNGETKTKCKYQAHKTGLTPLQQAGGLSFNVYAPASYDPKVG